MSHRAQRGRVGVASPVSVLCMRMEADGGLTSVVVPVVGGVMGDLEGGASRAGGDDCGGDITTVDHSTSGTSVTSGTNGTMEGRPVSSSNRGLHG